MARAATNPGIGANRPGRRAEAGRRSGLDLASILGLLAGFSLIATAMVLGGSPTAFIDGPAICIVIGGTAAVTAISFTPQDMLRTQGIIIKALTNSRREPAAAAYQMLDFAEKARADGVLSLERLLPQLADRPFLQRCMGLVADGNPGDEIETTMEPEIAAVAIRHNRGAEVLRRAAEVSPAMGLIGTLIGLVQMLGNLDDPSTIGPSMAVALLTTFYGAVLANMVFTPLASKLERNSQHEILIMQIFLMGAASIGRQENPRRLEMLLNSVLPPSERVQKFK